MPLNKTKIIATIGPASNSPEMLAKILAAGADIIRMNGAHGSIEEKKKNIETIKYVRKRLNTTTAILFDLPGPKLRLGILKRESIRLKTGDNVVLECGLKEQTGKHIPVPEKFIAKAVKKGSTLYINDGMVELKVIKVVGKLVTCRISAGGEIKSKKGINLPNINIPTPSLTKNDKKLLTFAIKMGVDFVGLSFVRSAKNILDLRKILKNKAPNIKIIAKIEKPEALEDLDNIIEVSDVIMIARGDLGIEMPFNELPVIQRKILKKCLAAGKPAITATQMMESMVSSARPTRAEATDVAIAIWEGTDAVMLSEETSIGVNPHLAVDAMSKIAFEAEKEMFRFPEPTLRKNTYELQAQVISKAAAVLAKDLNAKAIVTPTRSGRTALCISNLRPTTMIISPTENEKLARQMNLYWGVIPIAMPTFKTVDQMLRHAEAVALRTSLIKKGDTIVITSGVHGKKDDITRIVEVRKISNI